MTRQRAAGFTLVEMLVSIAILVILFGLLLKPLLMGMEVLSIGRGEQESQQHARTLINQFSSDLQAALVVYPNTAVFDLQSTGTRWRTPQTQRLDLVLPARDAATGALLTPVRPAYQNNDPTHPQVVTYWRMRQDPTQDYDPLTNPYRIYRAMYAYDATATNGLATPDDLWSYALAQAKAGASDLNAIGTSLAAQFAPTGPFNWFINQVDTKSPTPSKRIMRGPQTGAAFNNDDQISAVSTLTDPVTDVRQMDWLPALHEGEELALNAAATGYRGSQGRWVTPYQRSVDGQWTLPSTDLVPNGSNPLPLVARFEAKGGRSALLSSSYFVSLVQTAGAKIGHPTLFRLPDDGSAPVPVYDLTDYPKRVFAAAPGQANSGEFACGLNWETGELTTSFSQTDIICPDPDPTKGRIHAQNDPDSTNATSPPLYGSGTKAVDSGWQSFPLTYTTWDGNTPPNPVAQVGNNGAALDTFVADSSGASTGVWDGYTLSVFRPERLQTGTDQTFSNTPSATDRAINMSVVADSVQVQVVQYSVASTGGVVGAPMSALVRRVTYTPLKALTGGALAAGSLAPFRFYVDPTTGLLTFYDPQLDSDATTARDGLNPPAVIPDPDLRPGRSGNVLVPVIYVTYQYRNNLPTVGQVLLGDTSSQDVVEATYRTLNTWNLNLVLDVPTESTRGDTESYQDPLSAQATERPTGARKRVTVQTTLTVGAAH